MTLSNNYQPTKVSANGIIVDFGFTWNGLNTSYIKVYLEDKTTGDQTLVESTEYTFTAFNESGGNVRFNTAPADTNYVLIAREVSETQETPYKTSLGFNGEDVEASFDKLTGKVQELSETLDRTPTMPLGTETGAEFPVPVPGNLIQGNAEGTGWEDSGVSSQDLVDDAESARQSAIAAANSATDAANSATEASGYADDAEESATIAKESFKGDWADDYVDPISGLPGYTQGNTVVFGANQWWSKTDQNTSTPPLEYNTPSAEWEHYLRGAITNEEFVADVKEATFLGDGVTVAFDLTGETASFRPTSKNHILAVFIDTDPVSEDEYMITIDPVTTHSIITFTTAPDAPVDPNGTFNIIVRGATPKSIPELEDIFAIDLPINDELYYGGVNDASLQYTTSSTRVYDYEDYSYTINSLSTAPYESVSGYSAKDFEAKIKFELNNNTNAPLIGAASDLGSGNVCLFLVITNGTMYLYMSSDGNTWNIANGVAGTHSYPTSTIYNVVLRRDTNNWYVDYSLDNGETWINDITLNNPADLYELTLNWNWGAEYVGTDTSMDGKVFLDGTSLFLNGEYRFQPQIGDYIDNSTIWKGEARSDDNTQNITSDEFIRSPEVNKNVVPVMSSNSQDGYIITANQTYTTFEPYKAFDGVFGSGISNERWVTDTTSGWLQAQLPVAKKIKSYSIATHNIIDCPKDWTLQASNTGAFAGEEVILDTQTNISNWVTREVKFFNFSNDTEYLYYRLNITANNGDPTYISIHELTLSEAPIGDDLYLFVGVDSDSNTILEWDVNADGSGLNDIVGVKRRIGDKKDIVFPSDDVGDLTYFVREQGIYRFSLWEGYIATSTTLSLPRKIDHFRDMEVRYLASGDTLRTNFRRFPMAIVKDFYLNNAPRLEIRESTATVNHAVDIYILSRDVRFLGFENMAVAGVYGII